MAQLYKGYKTNTLNVCTDSLSVLSFTVNTQVTLRCSVPAREISEPGDHRPGTSAFIFLPDCSLLQLCETQPLDPSIHTDFVKAVL